jgi:anti-sigma B factor antagonist
METFTGTGLSVEPRREGERAVLAVTGEVDAASAPVLKDGLTRAIDSGARVVIVDMGAVRHIDSVGLGTLVVGLKRASEANVALRLVVSDPQVEKVFKITGLVSVFPMYHDLAAATSG